jgi:hypothetical protein
MSYTATLHYISYETGDLIVHGRLMLSSFIVGLARMDGPDTIQNKLGDGIMNILVISFLLALRTT